MLPNSFVFTGINMSLNETIPNPPRQVDHTVTLAGRMAKQIGKSVLRSQVSLSKKHFLDQQGSQSSHYNGTTKEEVPAMYFSPGLFLLPMQSGAEINLSRTFDSLPDHLI